MGGRAAVGRRFFFSLPALRSSPSNASPPASRSGWRPAISTTAPMTSTAALALIGKACAEKRAISVGLLGNAAEIFPELVRRGVRAEHRHRPDQRA